MQTISDGVLYTFGIRSLYSKLFKNLLTPVLIFIVGVIVIYSKSNPIWSEIDALVPVSSYLLVTRIIVVICTVSVVVQIISVLISYFTTKVMLSPSALTLKKGFFLKTEENFPLRFINNVTDQQNVLDQVFGVGTCTIEMMSDEHDSPYADKVIFEDMSHDLIVGLKETLLARTNIQHIAVANK